ncbi:MAG: dipeptidase [Planctomycetota bacterium]
MLLILAAVVAALVRPAASGEPGGGPDEAGHSERAKQIHGRVIALDSHVDVLRPQYATKALDPGIDHPRLQCDLVKMARGDVDGVFLAVYTRQGKRDAEGYRRAYDSVKARLDAIHRLAKTMYPDRCELATSPDQLERIAESRKRAIMIGVENGYPIGTDPSKVEKLYSLGVRYITLSHNGHNQICDSCDPSPGLGDKRSEHGGLSPFGERVVAEMNRLGMMIDVSHVSSESFWDLIEVSEAPLIASHSGCRRLNDHPRNLDDSQLKALAKNGGVIQVVAVGSFLKATSPERRQAVAELATRIGIPLSRGRPALGKATKQQRVQFFEGLRDVNQRHPVASIRDLVDHIEHAVRTAGVDHVGIGSDFDGGGGVPGFNDHSEALNVTTELLRRGYSEPEIRRIWGGNLLRVWREVEKVAAKVREPPSGPTPR